ncbi:MAG: UDP-N-acetylenolpyruvoylglucosamine reductase, partial [Christensenellaceae bacterium]
YSVGQAQVSDLHAGFIINKGGATARDVVALIEHIQRVVRERYGVELEPEIRRIGE